MPAQPPSAWDQAKAWLSSLWEAEFDGSLTEWLSQLKVPYSTRSKTFAPTESPWLGLPADSLLDPKVRQVTVILPAGAAKSLLGEGYSGYVVKNDDGLLYYVCQSDEAAQDVMEDRLLKLFAANDMLAEIMPLDRSQKRISKIQFVNVTLYALGAKKNASNSKRVKHLVCDETHLWEPGMLRAFKQRCNAVSGYKILILTTGSITDDETDKDFRSGTMHEWHVRCPVCKAAQAMKNANLRYEISERTMDHDQNFRWGPLRDSVYYQCEHCPAQWKDADETRRWLTDSGFYLQTNPNASGENVSVHMNALAIHWFPWADLAVEWIEANRAAKMGSFELLKEYIMKKLAEAWDERPREENPKLLTAREGHYEQGGVWDDGWCETTRFCTIDKQEGWFSLIIRAYSSDGQMRLVLERGGVPAGDALAVTTFEQCEEIREKYGVHPKRTFCDCAHFTREVQARCVEYGWQAFWGSDQKTWAHDLNSPFHPINIAKANRAPWKHISEKPVRLPFSPMQRGHANIGRAGKQEICTYYFWSNPTIKDFWHFLHNSGDGRWTQAAKVSKAYQAQTNAEVKRQEFHKTSGLKVWKWWYGKRANHFTDAEQMNLVAAMMDDRLSISAPEPIMEEV